MSMRVSDGMRREVRYRETTLPKNGSALVIDRYDEGPPAAAREAEANFSDKNE